MWRHIYGKVWEEVCAFPVTLSDCRSRSFEHKINLILFLIPFISATAEVFVSQISFWNKQSYWGEDVRGLHLFEAIDLPGSLSFTLMEVCKELTLVQISIILCRLFFVIKSGSCLATNIFMSWKKANAPSYWLWINVVISISGGFFKGEEDW